MGELHSMAASSHPSHCEWEIGEEATSRSWAGQFRRRGNRATVTASVGVPQHQRSTNVVVTPPLVTNVAAQQRQRTASVAVPPPPRPTADATMHVARQLLNNPPPTGASSSTVEQWCHDVDQLLVVAINTPPPRGITRYQLSIHSCQHRLMCHPHRVCHHRCVPCRWHEHHRLHVHQVLHVC
jgi:hypothetical protein